MYTEVNFQSKKAFKEAVANGEDVRVYQAGGIFPTVIPPSGIVCVEGPHYPQAHRWYAEVTVDKDRKVLKVK
jgi:hypothetical protein